VFFTPHFFSSCALPTYFVSVPSPSPSYFLLVSPNRISKLVRTLTCFFSRFTFLPFVLCNLFCVCVSPSATVNHLSHARSLFTSATLFPFCMDSPLSFAPPVLNSLPPVESHRSHPLKFARFSMHPIFPCPPDTSRSDVLFFFFPRPWTCCSPGLLPHLPLCSHVPVIYPARFFPSRPIHLTKNQTPPTLPFEFPSQAT